MENDKKTPTGLEGLLRSLGVTRVLVCGLATDYCVKSTALDARKAGFDVTVVEDAVMGIDAKPGDIQAAFGEMRLAGCDFMTTANLLNRMEQ